MSNYSIKVNPELKAIICSLGEHDGGQWLHTIHLELAKILDQQPERGYLILDTTNFKVHLDELIPMVKEWVIDQRIFHHPKLRESILVSTNMMYTLTAKGINSATFGYAKMNIMSSMQEAEDHIRKYLKS